MTRVIASIVLWLSTMIITRAVGIVGLGVRAINRGVGSTRSHAPVAVAAMLVWLLHAGFLLVHGFHAHDGRTFTAWLMPPLAAVGTVAAILAGRQPLSSHPDADTPATVGCTLMWAIAAIFGDIAPVMVMLFQPRLMRLTH